jgi:hypothetical protein
VPGSVEAEIADLEDVRCGVTPLVRRAALRRLDSRAAAPCLLGLPAHTVLGLRGAGREASTCRVFPGRKLYEVVGRRPGTPPKHRSDAGYQFSHPIGFGNEVVRAHLHPDDDVDLVRLWDSQG